MLIKEKNFTFDSDRLILLEKNFNEKLYWEIEKLYLIDNESVLPSFIYQYDSNNIDKKTYQINEINLCITYNCNFRCSYCDASSGEGDFYNLEINDIKAFIIDSIKKWKIGSLLNKNKVFKIYLSGGGEPTYDWNKFETVVTYISNICIENSISYELGITTNGYLNDKQLEFISKRFNDIMISYDGYPLIQRENRKSPYNIDTNDVVVNSIKYLKEKLNNVTVRTTIWQNDFNYMKLMADNIFGNISENLLWSIRPTIAAGRALLKANQQKEILVQADFLTEYLNIVAYTQKKYPQAQIMTSLFPNGINDYSCGEVSLFCDSPCLMPDGRILTCLESKSICTEIGIVKNGEVIYHKHYNDPLLENCKMQCQKCNNCIAYRFCKGGCPIRNIIAEQTISEVRDWECSMIKKYFVHILTSLIEGKSMGNWEIQPLIINQKEIPKAYQLYDKNKK